MIVNASNLALKRQRQGDHCELEASLICIASSIVARLCSELLPQWLIFTYGHESLRKKPNLSQELCIKRQVG